MGISLRQSDNLDRLPPERVEAGRIAPWHKPRDTWDVVIARAVGACGLTGFAALLTWLAAPAALPYVVLGGIGLAGAAWAKDHIVFERVRGVPVSAARLARVAPDAALDPSSLLAGLLGVDQTYAGAVVPAQQTYSPTFHQAVSTAAAQPAEPAALLPPAPVPVLSDTWLGWLDTQPHLLVAGRTGDGKTTLGNALLGRCISAGDEIAVIDPKWQPGKWRGCDPLAGSLDYGELYDALETVGAELDARYQEFNAGRPGETFPRLRVVIDEVPTIILGAIVGGKIINKRRFQQWLTFATKLGSIAREVNVNVWLFSQSPLIKDLYFSSAMRENFTRIALASQVRDLLAEESNKATKEALISLTRGQRFTAAMEYRSEYYVLDMADVPRIAQERVSAPRVWLPSARPVQAPVDYACPPAAKARDDGTVRVSVPPPNPVDAYRTVERTRGFADDDSRIAWLAYHTTLGTREIREIVGCHYPRVVAVAGDVRRRKEARSGSARR